MNNGLRLLLSLSLSGSFLILILLLLRPLLRHRFSWRWQYYIWLVVIARLLLPFTPENSLVGWLLQEAEDRILQGELSFENTYTKEHPAVNVLLNSLEDMDIKNMAASAEKTTILTRGIATEEQETEPAQNKTENSTISGVTIVFLFWLGTALVLLVRKAAAYQRFTSYIKSGSVPVSDIKQLNQLAELTACLGIRQTARLYLNPQLSSPMLLGFLRPCIVLSAPSPSRQDFHYICLHELTHYRRRDPLYKWLVQITICLHWFNPLVWWMGREINHVCELSCDEAVIRKLSFKERQAYGDTLLHMIQHHISYSTSPPSATSVMLGESAALLKERLGAIMKPLTPSKWLATLSLILTLALIMGATAAGAYSVSAAKNASSISDDLMEAYYTRDYYYQDGYLFEIAYNVRSTGISDSYSLKTLRLSDGTSMKVLFERDQKNTLYKSIIKSKKAKKALTALLSQLHIQTTSKETDALSLTAPLVISYQNITGKDLQKLAKQYYKENSLPQFHALFPLLSEAEQKTLLTTIYENGDIDFFSMAIKSLASQNAKSPLLKSIAQKVYQDGNITFFSVLTQYMEENTLKGWLRKAKKDKNSSFQAVLLRETGKEQELEEPKAALDAQRLQEYQKYGITKKGSAYYYNDQCVNILMDLAADSSFVMLNRNPKGSISIQITRKTDGSIQKVRRMTEIEVKELLKDME